MSLTIYMKVATNNCGGTITDVSALEADNCPLPTY
jgi:hypothetical protein